MKIIFIEHNGAEHVVAGEEGKSLMQIAVANSVPGIIGDCGGFMACATCHGFVDDAWLARLPTQSGDETALLDISCEIQHNSRLTCQIMMRPELDGIIVRLPKLQY